MSPQRGLLFFSAGVLALAGLLARLADPPLLVATAGLGASGARHSAGSPAIFSTLRPALRLTLLLLLSGLLVEVSASPSASGAGERASTLLSPPPFVYTTAVSPPA